ncbi:conserved hypothetical protein [Trichinella spiralis]|uniref:hypothetical protein n=1 Tax=Trichinella spiralis TaxID=6334 RepID=UPI0001EFE20A|nr:conserved hypothetical protein [Trichinella spiralis]
MCVGARLGGAFRRWGCVEGSASCHSAERRQPHTGVIKEEKDDVTQHLEALERPYEPLGELDASAAAAWTITDVTAPSYASENERRKEERWRPSTRRPVAWSRHSGCGIRLRQAGSYTEQRDQCNLAMATYGWGYSPSIPGEMEGSTRRAARYTRKTFLTQ